MDEQSSPKVVTVAEADDLAALDERALTSFYARANAEYAAAQVVVDDASQALGSALTEQIARRVMADRPGAVAMVVRFFAETCGDDDDIEAQIGCVCHDEKLVPAAILDSNGDELAPLDPFSPVMFWLERLTEVLDGADEMVLDLHCREWGAACDDDCGDECCP